MTIRLPRIVISITIPIAIPENISIITSCPPSSVCGGLPVWLVLPICGIRVTEMLLLSICVSVYSMVMFACVWSALRRSSPWLSASISKNVDVSSIRCADDNLCQLQWRHLHPEISTKSKYLESIYRLQIKFTKYCESMEPLIYFER